MRNHTSPEPERYTLHEVDELPDNCQRIGRYLGINEDTDEIWLAYPRDPDDLGPARLLLMDLAYKRARKPNVQYTATIRNDTSWLLADSSGKKTRSASFIVVDPPLLIIEQQIQIACWARYPAWIGAISHAAVAALELSGQIGTVVSRYGRQRDGTFRCPHCRSSWRYLKRFTDHLRTEHGDDGLEYIPEQTVEAWSTQPALAGGSK